MTRHFFKLTAITGLLIIALAACKSGETAEDRMALIKTNYGDITIKLYNETPVHRDNFIKLAESGFYDGQLFHRVINNMMIQAGDPKSKNAPLEQQLGSGDPGYKLPAEIHFPKYYHKRGALAAARQPDQVNPDKQSSGSQFYIVQGMVYDTVQLKTIAVRMNDTERGKAFNRIAPKYQDSMNMLMYSGMHDKLLELQDSIMAETDREFLKNNAIFTFNAKQIEDYTSIGGTPFLDGLYTIFGEVVTGMNIVDSIASSKTNDLDRPVKDITLKIKMLN